jgi:hypothetical protein
LRGIATAFPELVVVDVDSVDEFLIPKSDAQGHNRNFEFVDHALRQIAGTISDNANTHAGKTVPL